MPEPGGKPPSAMPAEFGLATATFVIVASMVGTGILTTSGYTVEAVGSNQLMLGLWVFGGIAAAAGALTLSELSAAMPQTGGDYVYLNAAYGPLVAFLSGWVSLVMGFAGPAAASAIGASVYIIVPLKLDEATAVLVQRVMATVFVLLFAVIHNTGRQQTARVQAVITAVKLGLLLLFVIAGVIAGRGHFGHLADRPPLAAWPIEAMTFSLVYIAYAYTGWNAASYLAGEFVDPQRQLPRAILLGTLGVVVLYLGVNLVYALALSVDDVRAIVNSPENHEGFKPNAVKAIAEIASRRLFGGGISGVLSVAFGLMLLSSLSAYLLTGPRVIYAMAVAGHFPAIAGRLTARAGTPAIATVIQTAFTLVFIWVGSLADILQYASVGLSIFSLLAVASVYVLRTTRPDLPRPFRTPGYPVTPALFLIPTAALVVAVIWQKPAVSAYALLSILAGVPFYYIATPRRHAADSA